MIRRAIVAIAIVVLFLAACYAAALPFAAELRASGAGSLEAAGRLDSAMKVYRQALTLDPLNARYYGELGRLYLKKTRGVADTGLRQAAKDAYAKAITLNSADPRYRIGWGEAESLLLMDKRNYSDGELSRYVDNFRKAVELAPNNYYVNAVAGYYILIFRKSISARDRNFAIYRMRYALDLNPGYANEVFSYVANGLGDFNLLYKITPQAPRWQKALRDFLRNIDRWKYRK